MASEGRIICIGGVLWETSFLVDEIPGRGMKLLPRGMQQIASGMAVSAAAAIARLGHPVELWSLVGQDANGRACLDNLAADGIDVGHLLRLPEARTPVSTILVDPAGERLVVPYFDPRLYAAPLALPLERLEGAGAVLVDMRWADAGEVAMRHARSLGVPTVLDADLAPPERLRRLMPLADHVLLSEVALDALSGGQPPDGALRGLIAELPGAAVVGVTLGPEGALVWERAAPDLLQSFPAERIQAVDTLNAGDIWHGAYVHGLVRGLGTRERVRFAHAAAAIKCERPGGRLGAPTLAEVLSRLG
ncbi:PfkB family carbohydrate kinase [Roseomonas gilardii subsp. gilardii]|uniref:PfkB family carbohydrate kinase n=1 Tax=Roseomonas gilardii TaxID=257708 RepID=UPI001FF7B64F|nr:PfkB family carbohydrate kinase [Roseomonas gilardii]UPG72951.1 PfkB family carbohydrate kinase [Roseomonas gilardii subsp. gilardii]